MWAREVLHGVVNAPRIDGKDRVAGSRVLASRLSTDVNDSGGEHLVGDLLGAEVGTPGWDSNHRPTELHQVAISRACLSLGPSSRIAVRELIDLDVDAATVTSDERDRQGIPFVDAAQGDRDTLGDEGHVQPLGRF